MNDCKLTEGEGRCDLLPILTIADILDEDDTIFDVTMLKKILCEIAVCLDESNNNTLRYNSASAAIKTYASMTCHNIFDLLLDVSFYYEEEAKKYSERNWEKGLPPRCFLDSAIRHLFKRLDDRSDEDHGGAFVWNMFGFMLTLKRGKEI